MDLLYDRHRIRHHTIIRTVEMNYVEIVRLIVEKEEKCETKINQNV